MKRLLLIFFLPLSFYTILSGQSFDYGNDWYTTDPTRTFIKIQVWEDGLYRVSPADLSAAGHDISAVDPTHLQLWYRGEEQPIHVAETTQGDLAFLEFLGRRNDGAGDSMLYRDPIYGIRENGHQPQPEISLFSDTSAYFLTWDGTAGLRYQSIVDTNYQSLTPQASYPFEAVKEFHPNDIETGWMPGGASQYDAFFTLNPDYVTGEGYGSADGFGPGNNQSYILSTPQAANAGGNNLVSMRLFGRSNSPHKPIVSLNGHVVFDTLISTNSIYLNTIQKISNQNLSNANTFLFESASTSTDLHHVLRLSIRYDRLPNLEGAAQTTLSQWQHNTASYFQFAQSAGTDSLWVIDPLLQRRISGVMNGSTAKVILPPSPQTQDLWLFTDQAVQSPSIVPQHNLHHLCAPDSGASFVIITHPDLAASAEAYAQYRDTNAVNSFSTKIVYTNQIYDEFGHGSPSPWAIKRFVNCAIENWANPPEYILLWGKGHYRLREFSGPIVPTYGYPATDLPYVEPYLPNSTDIEPQMAIGRVNLSNDADGFTYMAKVDELEHQAMEDWQRKGLLLAGGSTLGEQAAISSHFQAAANLFTGPPYHGIQRTVQTSFTSDSLWLMPDSTWIDVDSGSLSLDPDMQTYVSSGLGWVQFFGHSTSNLQEIPLGEPDEYGNWGRYPFFMMMGCYSSNPAATTSTYTERWMFEPGRGSIGYLSTTTAAYLNPLRDYSAILLPKLLVEMPGSAIGDLVKESVILITDSLLGIQYRNHARQMMLFCDPALRLFSSPINPPLTPVWPGDANDDGVANMVDLLNIGLAYGQSDEIRPGSLSWYAQPALDWSFFFEDGTNLKHADCDGNATVESIDTVAISLNYGLTHNKHELSNFFSTGMPVSLVSPDSINEGDTIILEVFVGDQQSQDSLYGIALQVQFDPDLVKDSLIWVDMDQSWMGIDGQTLISMNRVHPADGQVDLAFTRIDHIDTVGYGKLADISIVITDDIAKRGRAAFLPWLSYGYAVEANGEEVPLRGIATVIESPIDLEQLIQVFPNPASHLFVIASSGPPIEKIHMYNATGKLCLEQNDLSTDRLPVSVQGWSAGIYLVQVEVQGQTWTEKVEIR